MRQDLVPEPRIFKSRTIIIIIINNIINIINIITYIITYFMAQQPLKSFDRPLIRV